MVDYIDFIFLFFSGEWHCDINIVSLLNVPRTCSIPQLLLRRYVVAIRIFCYGAQRWWMRRQSSLGHNINGPIIQCAIHGFHILWQQSPFIDNENQIWTPFEYFEGAQKAFIICSVTVVRPVRDEVVVDSWTQFPCCLISPFILECRGIRQIVAWGISWQGIVVPQRCIEIVFRYHDPGRSVAWERRKGSGIIAGFFYQSQCRNGFLAPDKTYRAWIGNELTTRQHHMNRLIRGFLEKFLKLDTPMSSQDPFRCALFTSFLVGATMSCNPRLDAASSKVLNTLITTWSPVSIFDTVERLPE